jgi:hypothetical protein
MLMDVYYCEVCKHRIMPAEVESGRVNVALDRVVCAQCSALEGPTPAAAAAPVVMHNRSVRTPSRPNVVGTVRGRHSTSSIQIPSALKAKESGQHPNDGVDRIDPMQPRKNSGILSATQARLSSGQHTPGTSPEAKAKLLNASSIGGSVCVMGVIVFLLLDSKQAGPGEVTPETRSRPSAAELKAAAQQKEADAAEIIAREAYAELTKFESVAPGDLNERLNRVDAFLKKYTQPGSTGAALALQADLKRQIELANAAVEPVVTGLDRNGAMLKENFEGVELPDGVVNAVIAADVPKGRSGKALLIDTKIGVASGGYSASALSRRAANLFVAPAHGRVRFRYHLSGSSQIEVLIKIKDDPNRWSRKIDVPPDTWSDVDFSFSDLVDAKNTRLKAGEPVVTLLFIARPKGKDDAATLYIDDLEIVPIKPAP